MVHSIPEVSALEVAPEMKPGFLINKKNLHTSTPLHSTHWTELHLGENICLLTHVFTAVKMTSTILKSYTHDTTIVATWLAITARSRGCPTQLLEHSEEHKGGRLKGKARKEAKSASDHDGAKKTYILPLQSFIPLAEFLRQREKPQVQVPIYFIVAIDRAISLREKYGQNLRAGRQSRVASEEESISDLTHDHFINILKSVKANLEARLERGPRPKTGENATVKSLLATFSNLAVEDGGYLDEEPVSHSERIP